MDEHQFVFTNGQGEPLSPYSITKQWHDVRTRAGVPALRLFHDLRPTAVSLLLALGVPPHVVREIAGHSDVKITMDGLRARAPVREGRALAQLGAAAAGASLSPVAVNLRTR